MTSSSSSATQIARNAGFENYRDYAFRQLGRFDYTPEDCVQFHDAVEREIMPVVREIQADRRQQLGLENCIREICGRGTWRWTRRTARR